MVEFGPMGEQWYNLAYIVRYQWGFMKYIGVHSKKVTNILIPYAECKYIKPNQNTR